MEAFSSTEVLQKLNKPHEKFGTMKYGADPKTKQTLVLIQLVLHAWIVYSLSHFSLNLLHHLGKSKLLCQYTGISKGANTDSKTKNVY